MADPELTLSIPGIPSNIFKCGQVWKYVHILPENVSSVHTWRMPFPWVTVSRHSMHAWATQCPTLLTPVAKRMPTAQNEYFPNRYHSAQAHGMHSCSHTHD